MQKEQKPLLSLHDVSLSYPGSRSLFRTQATQVLSGLNFDLYSGETVGIIGRNGAGKSSLLRVLAGVLQPDGGEIVQHQQDLKISLLSMQLGFQQHLTGRENAILGCLIMGLSRREAEQLQPEIIRFSGLSTSIDETLGSYSSGMRARLGFSVAFFTKSDVMLIDEVLGVGDHEFKLKSRDALLSAIVSERTAVIVSHDEHFLTEWCDHLIWLEHGHFVMKGKPAAVLETYHDFDHIVLQLAADMGLEAAAVRSHPRASEPVALVEGMRAELRQERSAQLPLQKNSPLQSSVHYFHPGQRQKLSSLCLQECGTTAWVENTQLIAQGSDRQVRSLFLEYEDTLFTIARASKVDPHMIRHADWSRQLVNVLAHLNNLNRTNL